MSLAILSPFISLAQIFICKEYNIAQVLSSFSASARALFRQFQVFVRISACEYECENTRNTSQYADCRKQSDVFVYVAAF